LDKLGPRGLNDLSHRPKNVRKPITSWEIVSEVVRIRKQYPTSLSGKMSGIK
jgi:hypothetical protein